MMGILLEPIIIRQFWRERRGVAARIQLRKYEGRARVDLRVHVYYDAEIADLDRQIGNFDA